MTVILAKETGETPATMQDIAQGADVVILAIPTKGIRDLQAEFPDKIAFDPVDAGGLDESWRQQPGSPTYCTDLDVEHMLIALSQATNERKPEASGIRTSEEELKAAQEMQIAFYESFNKAIQVLMESNQWSEATANKRLVAQFMAGNKSPVEILGFVFEHN